MNWGILGYFFLSVQLFGLVVSSGDYGDPKRGYYLALDDAIETKITNIENVKSIRSVEVAVYYEKENSEYLYVSAFLLISAPNFVENIENFLFIKRKGSDWSEATMNFPDDCFSVDMIPYLYENEILDFMRGGDPSRFKDFCRFLKTERLSSLAGKDRFRAKVFLMEKIRNQEELNLEGFDSSYVPTPTDKPEETVHHLFGEGTPGSGGED